MSTEIYEAPFNLFAPAFSFSALSQRSAKHAVTTSGKKIEGEGEIKDRVATTPSEWTLQGRVKANELDPATLQAQPLANAQKRLEELIKKKAIVLILSGDVFNEYALLTSVEPSQSTADGDTLVVSLTFQEMRITQLGTTQIPPSRMRRKVKRKAAAPAKGGASKPRTSTDNRGNALKGVEYVKGSRFR